MDQVPLKLNIDQIGKRQRCTFLFPVIVVTICLFIISAVLSPTTRFKPSGPIAMCDDPNYDPMKGYCSFLKYQADKSVFYNFRVPNVKSLHKFIMSEMRPVLKTNNPDEVGKF